MAAITLLSQANAFGLLPKTRRLALWETLALPDDLLPLLMKTNPVAATTDLPLMSTGQEIRDDYGTLGLFLKGHSVALVREELTLRKIISAAGVRQRRWACFNPSTPGTGKGIVFETLEDETGIVNLIIRSLRKRREHAPMTQKLPLAITCCYRKTLARNQLGFRAGTSEAAGRRAIKLSKQRRLGSFTYHLFSCLNLDRNWNHLSYSRAGPPGCDLLGDVATTGWVVRAFCCAFSDFRELIKALFNSLPF